MNLGLSVSLKITVNTLFSGTGTQLSLWSTDSVEINGFLRMKTERRKTLFFLTESTPEWSTNLSTFTIKFSCKKNSAEYYPCSNILCLLMKADIMWRYQFSLPRPFLIPVRRACQAWTGCAKVCVNASVPQEEISRCLDWFIMSRDIKPITFPWKYAQSYFPNFGFTSSHECPLHMNVDAQDTMWMFLWPSAAAV